MAYRIHPAHETPETVLDHSRPMGFYADEIGQDHIKGISGCQSIVELARWASLYSANVRVDDYILKINGEDYSIDCYDAGEVVCLPTEFEVIGTGADFAAALEAVSWADGDEDELAERLDDINASPAVRFFAAEIFED